jgi:integrase
MTNGLTAAAVEKYRPSKKRREIPDHGCRGLYLIVQPSGAKSWAMRFRRPDGKPAKMTLGSVDQSGKEMPDEPVIGAPLTLAGARVVASAVHRKRMLGRDVISDLAADRHRQKAESETAAANSFSMCVRDFIAEHAKPKTRRWDDTARLLGLRYPKDGASDPEVIPNGLVARWGDRPAREIDGHDIWGIVDETRRRGAPGLPRRKDGLTEGHARSMFAALSSCFGWLQKNRRIDVNPCAGVARPEMPKARDRVLSDAEIVKFWKASSAVGEPAGGLLRLLLITGARLDEVSGMTRAELSEDGSMWNLPGARTKNHRAHLVPLPLLAREILQGVRQVHTKEGFVFSRNGRRPIFIGSKIKARLDNLIGEIPPWRVHDLRRTAATGMAEIGIAPHVVEAVLNHVSGAKASVAGTYNRAAYGPEKKHALERWAAHVEGLVSGKSGSITPIHDRRARS